MARPIRVGQPPKISTEVALQRELNKLVRQVRASAGQVRTATDARRLGAALRKAWPHSRILAVVKRIGARAEREASAPWGRAKLDSRARMDASPYDGEALLAKWALEAASLIRSVRDDVARGMARDVAAATAKGIDPARLAAHWKAQGIPLLFGTLEGRVKVIAQHQLSTLHAQVQSARARAVGVAEFRWRTQGDNKVRPAHRELEGTRHKYTDPPNEGLPGTPVGCRCWAESIIEDELVETSISGAIGT